MDPFISGDNLAYQQLSHKLDKALQQVEEEDDNLSWTNDNDNLLEDLSDEWNPSDTEQAYQPPPKISRPSNSPSTGAAAAPQRKRKPRRLPPKSTTPKKMKNHQKGTFPCPLCSKTFPYQLYLTRHTKFIHNNSFSSICSTCGASFPSDNILHKHTPRCTGKSLPCPIPSCPRKLASENALTNHLRNCHGDQAEDPRKTCNFCGKVFPIASALRSHIELTHQQSEDTPFTCDLCGVAKGSNHALKHHRK